MANFFAEMFSTFVAQGLPRDLWEQLRPWVATFGSSVLERWSPIVARKEGCGHVSSRGNECVNVAVCECGGCGELVCLLHAYVRRDAKAICVDCVSAYRAAARDDFDDEDEPEERYQRRRGEAPPTTDARAKALEVLGLSATASFEEVQVRFRKLSREYHPDRFVDAVAKRLAEEKFKALTEAYHVLERMRRAA